MPNKYLSHVEIEQTLGVLRVVLQKEKRLATAARIGGGGVADGLATGTSTWHGGDPVTAETSEGLDFSTGDLTDKTGFTTYKERWEHLDHFFGRPVTQKFSGYKYGGGISYRDGHVHSNVDGDGPSIAAVNILAPEGAVGDNDTAAAHMLDTAIHLVSGNPTKVLGISSSFDEGLVNWRTMAGTSAKDTFDASSVMVLNPGTRMRLKGSPDTWMDAFIIEYRVHFDSTSPGSKTVEVWARVSDDAVNEYHMLVFRVSASDSASSGIYIVNRVNGYCEKLTPAVYNLAVGDGWYTNRIVIARGKAYQWIDVDGVHKRQCAAIPINTTGDGAAKLTGGYIELAVNAQQAKCYIDTFTVSKMPVLDATDLSDTSGVFTTLPPGAHNGTHYTDGSDTVDAGSLADSQERMLSVAQRQGLMNHPVLSEMHYHDDTDVQLSPGALGGHTTLRQHVEDTTLHASASPSDRKQVAVNPGDSYYVESSILYNKGGGTNGIGFSRADHSHTIPCWEVTQDYTQNPLRNVETHCCDSEYVDAASFSEFSPDPAKFKPWYKRADTLPMPLRYMQPTIGGDLDIRREVPREMAWNKYLRHSVYRLRVWVDGSFPVTKWFFAYAYGINTWITVKNSASHWKIMPFPGLWAHYTDHEHMQGERVDVTLQPGYNDVYVYAFFLLNWGVFRMWWLHVDGSTYDRGALIYPAGGVHYVSPYGQNPVTNWEYWERVGVLPPFGYT